MGVFYTSSPPAVEEVVAGALLKPQVNDEETARAEARRLVAGQAAGRLETTRLLVAATLVLLLIAGGVWLEQIESEASTTVFGFATTLFGLVVGFLGGERR